MKYFLLLIASVAVGCASNTFRADMKYAVYDMYPEVEACYLNSQESPRPQGELWLRFRTDEKGAAISMRTVQPVSEKLDRCVSNVIYRTQFPTQNFEELAAINYRVKFTETKSGPVVGRPPANGIPTAEESEKLKQVLSTHRPNVELCYARMPNVSSIKGRMVVNIETNSRGIVQKTFVERSVTPNLDKCVKEEFAKVTFPELETTVGWDLRVVMEFDGASVISKHF